MLIMSAPKNLFIGHRLLYVGTTEAVDWPTSGNARCRPTPNVESVGVTDARLRRCLKAGSGVRGTLKVPGVVIRRAAFGGFPRLCVDTSRANPWLEKSGPGRRPHFVAARCTRVQRDATTKVSTARGRALESSASIFPAAAYLNC